MPQKFFAALDFMGRVLQVPPDTAYLREIETLGLDFFAWPGVSVADAASLWQAVSASPAELAAALAEDHARIFSGPDPLAPPWESVWLEREKLLFGERTRAVEALYADWGVENANRQSEPGDHLGLELGFLLYLLAIAAQNPAEKSLSGKSLQEAQQEIYYRHIMQFAPKLLAQTQAAAKTSFYRLAVRNSLKMLPELANIIPENN